MKYLILLLLFGTSFVHTMDTPFKSKFLELTLILRARPLLPELIAKTFKIIIMSEMAHRQIFYKKSIMPNSLRIGVMETGSDREEPLLTFEVIGTVAPDISKSKLILYTVRNNTVYKYSTLTGQRIERVMLLDPSEDRTDHSNSVRRNRETDTLIIKNGYSKFLLSVANDDEVYAESMLFASVC
jgi:hypothetical protein